MHPLQEKDLKYIWHPCSQMKDYETFPPIIIERGEGINLYDIEGKKYIDCISSWWVNLFGHNNKRINNALINQVNTLEHVIFSNFSHAPAINLCEKIINISPQGLSKVFFGDNGSSAVEIALKLSFQYHKQTGFKNKTKFVSLKDGYHGETIGALSVSKTPLYSSTFKELLLDVIEVTGPDCFRCPFKQKRETCNAECFVHMEETISKNHEHITGVIIEPIVQCASGMKIYSPKYLKKLRILTEKYNINLIADEIAVGFYRTGELFGVNHGEITPDMMCVSKGLTGGYLPLSLCITTDKIYNAFYDDYEKLKSFLHSHSYSGNPLSCAVSIETLNILTEPETISMIKNKSEILKETVTKYFENLKYVGEIRSIGMICAIELVKDKHTLENFNFEDRVGYNIYKIAIKKGLLLRPLGNVLYFMPPYTITKNEIENMVFLARESYNEYFKRM